MTILAGVDPSGGRTPNVARSRAGSTRTAAGSPAQKPGGASSAEGPYSDGTGMSFIRRYTPSCARW